MSVFGREAQRRQEIAAFLEGKTISAVTIAPYGIGCDGAAEGITLLFTDGSILDAYAGSYIIPEEACIYFTIKESDAG